MTPHPRITNAAHLCGGKRFHATESSISPSSCASQGPQLTDSELEEDVADIKDSE